MSFGAILAVTGLLTIGGDQQPAISQACVGSSLHFHQGLVPVLNLVFSAPEGASYSMDDLAKDFKFTYDWGYGRNGEGDHILNDELECYSSPSDFADQSPIALSSDGLILSADRLQAANREHCWGKPYISGLISTSETFRRRFGLFEWTAALPKGRGLWPAFWLLEQNGPNEIDVMEAIGEPDIIYISEHQRDTAAVTGKSGATIKVKVDDPSRIHTYAVLWRESALIWFVDGREVGRVRNPGLLGEMYLISNLAVGGKWPKSPTSDTAFPARITLRSIRVISERDVDVAPAAGADPSCEARW